MKRPAKERFLLLGFIATAISAGVEPAAASTGIFQITGNIHDALGNPVGGVSVSVDDYVGDVFTGTSESDGAYLVEVDSDSNYRVTLDCNQLMALGYACAAPVALTVNDGGLELNFTVELDSAPLQITNTFLPAGNVGPAYHAQLGATGGKPPYSWALAQNSAALPGGLLLDAGGVVSGMPLTNTVSFIRAQVTDANSNTTNRVFSVVVNARPSLSAVAWSNGQFLLWLSGASNQNYTLQAIADLNSSNWMSFAVTNNPAANAFMVIDAAATNQQRWYRVLIGP